MYPHITSDLCVYILSGILAFVWVKFLATRQLQYLAHLMTSQVSWDVPSLVTVTSLQCGSELNTRSNSNYEQNVLLDWFLILRQCFPTVRFWMQQRPYIYNTVPNINFYLNTLLQNAINLSLYSGRKPLVSCVDKISRQFQHPIRSSIMISRTCEIGCYLGLSVAPQLCHWDESKQ